MPSKSCIQRCRFFHTPETLGRRGSRGIDSKRCGGHHPLRQLYRLGEIWRGSLVAEAQRWQGQGRVGGRAFAHPCMVHQQGTYIYIYTIYSISPFLGTFFTSQIFGRTTELLPFSVGGWSTSLPPLAQVVDGPVALRTRCQRREEATDRAPGGHRDARNGARTDANRTGLRSPNKM